MAHTNEHTPISALTVFEDRILIQSQFTVGRIREIQTAVNHHAELVEMVWTLAHALRQNINSGSAFVKDSEAGFELIRKIEAESSARIDSEAGE